jgi:hypothetical protein
MFDLFYKYLIINRQVGIPGIGLFQLSHSTSKIDAEQNVIHPPVPQIKFTQKSTGADKKFFQFVSTELKVQEWESIRRFHDFTYKLKNDLNSKQSVELAGIGLLIKNNAGDISFEPDNVLSLYYPSITIDHVYQKEVEIPKVKEVPPAPPDNDWIKDEEVVEETIVKTERWWIAAAILAIISIAGIIYYYLNLNPYY